MTGFTATARRLIDWRDRDDGALPWPRCQACGVILFPGSWGSRQHRAARGMGGRRDDVHASAVNGVWLCGSATSRGCHRLCEDRDPVMRERGFWLSSWDDLAAVPVTRWDGTVAWPAADGRWVPETAA